MTNKISISIIGAGIAGLSAAIALAHKGFNVTLLEKSFELTEVGAGLQLSPNATRILSKWGLTKNIAKFCADITLLAF